MTKLKLLATTAILIGTISMSSHANASEQSWYQSMTQSVKNWFAPQQDTTAEMKAYLDEVTIAVPPMTADEASQIEPAAGGDYQPTLEEALEKDGQSFNSAPVFSNSGSVAAFEDPITVEDLANIMPAAGDAEEIVDEAIVVVEETTTEMATDIAESTVEMVNEAVEAVTPVVETSTETEITVEETVVEDTTESETEVEVKVEAAE